MEHSTGTREAGMITTAAITWTKLRDGSWGISGPADDLRAGSVVTVSKKDGSQSPATVGAVVWTGGGRAIARVGASAPRSSYRSSGYRGGYGRRESRCHTDGNCSSMCSPSSCPCGDGGWFRCC